VNNYLLAALMDYFSEVNSLAGRMHAISVIVPLWREWWLEKNPNAFRFQESGIFFRDLSQAPKTDNLIMPDVHYEIVLDTIADEAENMVSRECGVALSQAYEIFETYIFRLLSEYFCNNQQKLVECKLIEAKLILPKEEIIRLLRKSAGTNNKGLIRIVRRLSPHFKKHESSNYLQVNIVQWFDLLSMVRHTVVHNRQAVSHRFLDYLEKHRANGLNDLFNRQFQRKRMDDRICILFTNNQTQDAIAWLNSFAHLIFKSLSLEVGLPTAVPLYIPPPPWSR
jgi:hypothetical protein